MAKRNPSRFSLAGDDVLVEKHAKNLITGNERISRRSYTRDCVPIIDALSRSILVVGLVVSAIILVSNMNPESKKLDEASKMYVQKISECNARLGECCAVLSRITNSIAHSNINLDEYMLVLETAIDYRCEWCKCPCCILENGCK